MKNNLNIHKLFVPEYTFPFKLLVVQLIFSRTRPDRLISGAEFLKYFPVVILLILLFNWLNSSKKILHNSQTKFFLAFCTLLIFQLPFARNPSVSFTIVKGTLGLALIGYLVKVQFIDSLFKLEKYINIMLIFSIFFAVLGIAGKGTVNLPMLGDENDFCLFMNVLIPFSYFLGQETNNGKKKMFCYLTMLIFILGNVLSVSRGGFVGLAAVTLHLLYRSKSKITYLFLAFFLFIGVIIFAPEGYWAEMQTIQTEGTTVGTGKERIETWKAGWKMFLDHPIIGVGARNFGIWLPRYYTYSKPSTMWGRVAHSLYVTLLSEMGIVGCLLFVGVLWATYKDHRYISELEKKKEQVLRNTNLPKEDIDTARIAIRKLYFFSLAYEGALLAYFVTGAFISVLWYGYFWFFISLYVITANIAKRIEMDLLTIG